jgi:citrate lyase subunit beta/citryl-CoA lyase
MRSLLFVPGHDPRKLARSLTSGADVLVPDLEDAVPEARKVVAREGVGSWLTTHRPEAPVYPRINAGACDEMASLAGLVAGFMVPKVTDPKEVRLYCTFLDQVEEERGLPAGALGLIPLIETAAAVWCAMEIATASPRVVALAFGAEDFAAEMGTDGATIARALVPIAARAAGVAAIDTPCIRVHDSGTLRAHLTTGRALGYGGALAVHPAQIEAVHAAHTPTPQDVGRAARVVEAASMAGGEVALLDGELVGPPMVARARRVLDRDTAARLLTFVQRPAGVAP